MNILIDKSTDVPKQTEKGGCFFLRPTKQRVDSCIFDQIHLQNVNSSSLDMQTKCKPCYIIIFTEDTFYDLSISLFSE